jgi:N-methylhydantoinase A
MQIQKSKNMKLGIDIGGTFTDLVLLNEKTGELHFAKTLTTYPNPADGILTGTQDLLTKTQVLAQEISEIVHGTTLVTNAVIERKGAKTGLITTQGFEDVLEIGREMRYDIYDLNLTIPEPLVPRNLRLGVSERVNKNGEAIKPLNIKELEKVIQQLMAQNIQAVGVCFLHSFTNPAHEKRVGEYLQTNYPQLFVSLSCEVMPEIREYERTSATVMNAYVQPITSDYLQELEKRLQALGFQGIISIMISSGKLTTLAGAAKFPVQLLESGPAGGSMVSVFFGKITQNPNLFVFDMGGTTAKASLIQAGKPEITNQFEAARVRRFKKGSGLPVRIPVIDLIEIGAGGGSIAYVDKLGLLKVGPESASSSPGPACYGLGGSQATVTDADLVLGYLNENYFLGGTMTLNRAAAYHAIAEEIAKPLKISPEEAAAGIHRIVNENMANAARVHILEKGYDPRRFAMIAFGGAGPVHAFQVARLLGSPQMIVPVGAGVASALGFLVSPMASEDIRSYVCNLEDLDWAKVNVMLAEMEAKGLAFLERAGILPQDAHIQRVADMRYEGQGHEITVSIPAGQLNEQALASIEQNFKAEYQLRYGRTIDNIPKQAVTWRVSVSGKTPDLKPKQALNKLHLSGNNAQKGSRQVYMNDEKAFRECAVYDRYLLPIRQTFTGPAIIEEMESTTIIGNNSTFYLDEFRNIVVDIKY